MMSNIFVTSLAVLSCLPLISLNVVLSDSVSAFLELLNIKDKTCHTIEWCTLRKTTGRSKNPGFNEVWYSGCSCHERCLVDNTCCPDFKISQILKDKIYFNVSSFISAILENSKLRGMQMAIENTEGNYTHDDEFTACLQSCQILSSLNKPAGFTYRMVAICFNRNVHTKLKSMCETLNNISDNSSIDDIDDFLPVQSLLTGLVYRNKHCFLCSDEADSDYKEWDIYLINVGSQTTLFTAYPSSYEEVMNYNKLPSSNSPGHGLLFQPSDGLRVRFPPRICFNIDINICPSNTNTVQSNLSKACSSYLEPVFTENNGLSLVFNNLACYYCHNSYYLEQTDKCTFVNNLYSFWKLQRERSNGTWRSIATDNIDLTSLQHMRITSSTQCGDGRIYDSIKVSVFIKCPPMVRIYLSPCRRRMVKIN